MLHDIALRVGTSARSIKSVRTEKYSWESAAHQVNEACSVKGEALPIGE